MSDANAEDRVGQEAWMLAGQLLGAAVVALPAIGALIRGLAFTFGSTEGPSTLAVAVPVANLATDALPPVVAAVFSVALATGLLRRQRLPWTHGERDALRAIVRRDAEGEGVNPIVVEEAKRLLKSMVLREPRPWDRFLPPGLVLAVVLVAPFVLPLGYSALPMVLVGWPAAFLLAKALRRSSGQFFAALPGLLLLVVAVGLAAAVQGTVASVHAQRITFAEGANLGDGDYIVLGHSGEVSYLARCSQPDEVLSISPSQIASSAFLELKPQPARSILVMALEREWLPIGFEPICETPRRPDRSKHQARD